MAKFKFEICSVSSLEELKVFIDNNWVKNHIFVHSQELLDWQHKNKQNSCYNFILAREIKTGHVCGLLGYIFTSHFSSALNENKDVWLAIWKVKEGTQYTGLGLKLLGYLKREYSVKTICSIGLSKMVVPMYKALNFNVGQLAHFVLINDEFINNRILSKGTWTFSSITPNADYSLTKLALDDLRLIPCAVAQQIFISKPQKNKEYIENRYIQHPIFDYDIFLLKLKDDTVGLLVTRLIEKEGSQVIRIIDYQGDSLHLAHLNMQLRNILITTDAEYIDFVQYGISDNILAKSGFVNVDTVNGLIVPDYFEPLVKENMKLDFARLGSSEDFFLCKGDSDQDRPNSVKGW